MSHLSWNFNSNFIQHLVHNVLRFFLLAWLTKNFIQCVIDWGLKKNFISIFFVIYCNNNNNPKFAEKCICLWIQIFLLFVYFYALLFLFFFGFHLYANYIIIMGYEVNTEIRHVLKKGFMSTIDSLMSLLVPQKP